MRWSGLCLLALSIAARSAVAQEQGRPPESTQLPPEGGEASGSGLRWTLPPVKWSGSVGYELRIDHASDQGRTVEHMLTTTLNALTYLYQPWLALLSGTVSVTRSDSRASEPLPSTQDTFTTGALRLDVFPRSRFPLEMRYEVSDSRTDLSLGGNVDYRSRTVALTQRYRPASGDLNFSATYERRDQQGQTFGQDTQESLMADFSTRWKRNNLSASVSRSINRRDATDEEVDFRNVVARHSYALGTELTLETTANWAQTDERLLINPNHQLLAQWTSLSVWRPEGSGLVVTGSLRGFTFESDGQTTETLSAGLGASYEINKNFRLNGNVVTTRTDGVTASSWVGSLGGTYQGDSRTLGDFNYDWNAGATLSRSRSLGADDDTVSVQLGHTASRVWQTDPTTAWTLNLGEAVSASYTRGDVDAPGHQLGMSRAITHNAGLTWTSAGSQSNAYVRLSASDARQLDADHARFQILNFQMSGTYDVDRFRSWSGDLTVQRVFQRSLVLQLAQQEPVLLQRSISHTASGEITWRQQRIFGQPRLRFTSRLRLAYDTQYLREALLALPDRETASWENRLDYQIGRLETSAALRIARNDGLWREVLQLKLLRSF